MKKQIVHVFCFGVTLLSEPIAVLPPKEVAADFPTSTCLEPPYGDSGIINQASIFFWSRFWLRVPGARPSLSRLLQSLNIYSSSPVLIVFTPLTLSFFGFMFTRATNRSYTCLKCQYRLTLRESARIESQNINTRVPRRWQTSAASAIVEEEYEKDISEEPERDYAAENQESRSYYTRRWRPTPTANIGADVLGKPAEILLLPTRKRRRNKTLKEVDKGPEEDVNGEEILEKTSEQPQLKIHEALAQESKPTSRKDVVSTLR